MTVRRGRLLLVLLTVATLAAAAAAEAQGRAWRIRVLEPLHPAVAAHLVDAFQEGLRDLGYEEGRNVVIEIRFAEGRLERLPELAAELASRHVDVLVANGTPAIKAARQAAPSIPIIMSAVGDPVAEGFVESLARPGRNITGVTVQSPALSAKRLQLLREAAGAAAAAFGISLSSFRVTRADDLERAFADIARDGANGVFVFPNSITSNYGKRIADLAIKYRLPGIFGVRELTEAGGLLAYGPVRTENYRRAAMFVHQVLRGARAADLPIQQPTRFELVVNLRTAKTLTLQLPQSLLLRADLVIE